MAEQQLGFDLGADDRRPGQDGRPLFDPVEIRAEALALIAQARAVPTAEQWDEGRLRYHCILFPHLVSWLPDPDERAQLCFDFTVEADRIQGLLAAA